MASKAKSIFKSMCITGFLVPFFCLTPALKAQSADLSGSGPGALYLYGDLISVMQQDNETDEQSPLDDARCVLGSLIVAMRDIESCDDDPVCIVTTVIDGIVGLVECSDPDNEELLVATCIINDIFDGIQGIADCQDNATCIVSNVFTMILDIIVCVDTE